MSNIIDYKVISTELYAYKYRFDMIPPFIESINSYLKKGYTLHGNTKFNNTYSVTQVLIKYSKQYTSTHINEYNLIYMAVEGSGSETVGAGPVVKFEKDVLDELNNEWSFYSDIQIHRIIQSHRNEVHYMQAFVKYKKSEVNPFDI